MNYRYESPVGTFSISSERGGGVELRIDDIPIGIYDSVEEAYEDVARQSTGWDEWDRLTQVDIPDLQKWEEVPEGRTRH